MLGQAQPRSFYGPGYPSHYPGYGHGYYPGYGYGSYPWYGYGYYPWYGYGPGYGYGSWYYPFGVSFAFGLPYAYDSYPAYGYGGGGGDSSRDDHEVRESRRPTGSVRFRANPPHARVYVDGALVGIVDEFDGLGDHLVIESGRHQIELRADGYANHSSEVSVKAGRTVTERANLKKIN